MRLHYYDICDQHGSVRTSQWLTTEEVRFHELKGFIVRLHKEPNDEPNNIEMTHTVLQTSEFIRKSDLMDNFCGYNLNKARKHDNKTLEQRDLSYSTLMIYEIAMEIDDAPIIDAVEVVRCKDCKYYSRTKTNKKGYLICPASGMEIRPEDFCSYGERKETNDD